MTPSNNELNHIVFGYLTRLIKHENHIEDFFEKMTASDVYTCMIDDEYIEKNFGNMANKVYADIDDAFSEMERSNNGIFSYKYLQRASYRDIIMQSMKIRNYKHCELNYAEFINDKDVMVFDDTITTGKTISDSGKAIKDMFNPKSITYVTLFSAINKDR
jgi:phosphoribosylpyrophosphate synthetase